MFSTLHKTNLKFSVTFILSSANALNLDKPKISSFGNELNAMYALSRGSWEHFKIGVAKGVGALGMSPPNYKKK